MIRLPCFIINFKTYRKGTGVEALKIAKEIDKVAKATQKNIYVCPQSTDVREIKQETDQLGVLAQHVDPVGYGSNTGHILPESLKKAGATGTLLNHSEKKLKFEKLKKASERAKKAELDLIIDVERPSEIKKIEKLGPDCIGIEPPGLIGGDISVSEAKPELIEKSVEKTEIPIICGAGIKTQEDVEKALELGSKGILIASGIIKAPDPYRATKKLVKPL